MKIKILLLTLLISSCADKKIATLNTEKKITSRSIINLAPPEEFSSMQINRIPHPFNLNGENPYAVWVDGKRLSLDRNQVKNLAQSLNLKFKQPEDTAQIHQGAGWLFPLEVDEEGEEEIFIDN